MFFVIAFNFAPGNRNAVQARFKETGGLPPQGVKMLGRWHGIGNGKGVCVAQSDDPVALYKWAQNWSDLMSIEVYPVVSDEGLVKAIS